MSKQQATLYTEETGSLCPNCGERATFTQHSGYSTEPHGETHFDEWLTCDHCGCNTDEKEVEAMNTHPELCEYCGHEPLPEDYSKHVAECANRGRIVPQDPWNDDSRED
jgi:hypothetical protein